MTEEKAPECLTSRDLGQANDRRNKSTHEIARVGDERKKWASGKSIMYGLRGSPACLKKPWAY